jgi:hypothetical protein
VRNGAIHSPRPTWAGPPSSSLLLLPRGKPQYAVGIPFASRIFAATAVKDEGQWPIINAALLSTAKSSWGRSKPSAPVPACTKACCQRGFIVRINQRHEAQRKFIAPPSCVTAPISTNSSPSSPSFWKDTSLAT